MQRIVDELVAEMDKMPVIDSHEHMPPEQDVVSARADVFTRIYCHYCALGMISAGLKIEALELQDVTVPLEERWRRARPYLDSIRDTGFVRAAQIVARDLYGIDEINDATYLELSERLQAENTPGIFERILKKKCNIETLLTVAPWSHADKQFVRCVYNVLYNLWELGAQAFRQFYEEWKEFFGADFANAETLSEFVLEKVRDEKCVGLKFTAATPATAVDDATAEALFSKFKSSRITDQEASELGTWITHRLFAKAPRYSLVVTFHCGMGATSWEDPFRYDAANLRSVFATYRDTRFDLYHSNMPLVRQMGIIGHKYPNVHLNLVWSHQQSPFMVEHMLNEWMDLVPTSKIIGFGGDQGCPEAVYGALTLAKENIARALCVRIQRGLLSESRALEICHAWLYDNPRALYGLD